MKKILILSFISLILISKISFCQSGYTVRSLEANMDSLQDNTTGAISPENLRDAIGSAWDAASDSSRYIQDVVLPDTTAALRTELMNAISDSTQYLKDTVLPDTTAALRTELEGNIPLTARLPHTIVYADSTASNDSLTIEIKKQTPLGNISTLYIKNTTGLAEQIHLIYEFQTPAETANLDSIQFVTWTETTGTTDFGLVTIYDDSTLIDFCETVTATSDTLRSSVARTAVTQSITGIDIVGGRIRLDLFIKTEQDSMFFAEPKCYYTLQ